MQSIKIRILAVAVSALAFSGLLISCDKDKSNPPKPSLQECIALDYSGNDEGALACYDRLLAVDPNDAMAWANRATALGDLERFREALECNQKAIKLRNDNPQIWADRGEILNRLRAYEESLASFDKALLLNPKGFDVAKAWCGRAVALDALGRRNEAIESVNQALKISPSYRYAQVLLLGLEKE